MFRLTREVRYSINPSEGASPSPITNSYAGYPSASGIAPFLRIQVALEGPLDPQSCYLRNIKDIDQAVRERIILARVDPISPRRVFDALRNAFAGASLDGVTIWLTPFLSIAQLASEIGMYTRLSQKFEFSASHRLHNPKLSDEQNRKTYGKCNNPAGHGHNYEVQVTLRGRPNENGLLIDVPSFEQIVKEHAIDRLDHKHLNSDVPEFADLIPTVENIATIIHRMLKARIANAGAELASVTVWETPKTWCEYTE